MTADHTPAETGTSMTEATERQMYIARDTMMREHDDSGPIVASDQGPKGPRWWTPTRVYGADVERRGMISAPRNPPSVVPGDTATEVGAGLLAWIDDQIADAKGHKADAMVAGWLDAARHQDTRLFVLCQVRERVAAAGLLSPAAAPRAVAPVGDVDPEKRWCRRCTKN